VAHINDELANWNFVELVVLVYTTPSSAEALLLRVSRSPRDRFDRRGAENLGECFGDIAVALIGRRAGRRA
jgi:hypothetical protein